MQPPADSQRRNKLVLALKRAIEAKFTPPENGATQWKELGYATDTREYINNHPRLLRSLSWGDEDYGGHVLDAIEEMLQRDPTNLQILLGFDGLAEWIETNEPAVYREVIETAMATAGTRYKLRVFLCHGAEDKPAVRILYKRLSSEGDIDPWLDEGKLLPGQDWEYEIRRAIRASDAVVVCLSPRSVNKKGYVQKEIALALDEADKQPEGTIYIIPAKLELCDVPDRLTRLHWVNLYDDGGYDRLLRALRFRATSLSLTTP